MYFLMKKVKICCDIGIEAVHNEFNTIQMESKVC